MNNSSINNDTNETFGFTDSNIIYITFGSFSFVLNLLTFCVILLHKDMRDNYSLLISSLSLADAINGVFFMCVFTTYSLTRVNMITFEILDSFIYFCALSVQWHTVTLSVERLIAVQYPLTYHTIMTPLKRNILLCFLYVGAAASFVLFGLLAYFKLHQMKYILRYAVLINVILIIFINTTIYVQLWRVARKQRKQIAAQETHNKTTNRIFSKATISVILIVVIYIILWLPFLVTTIAVIFYPLLPDFPYDITQYIDSLWLLNSIINCVVYALLNKNFRLKVKSLFCRKGK